MKDRLSILLCSRSNFKICYFIFLSLNMIQCFNVSTMSRILLAFFSVWAFIIIISECLVKKCHNYLNTNIGYLLTMLIWCLIAFIGNWNNNGFYNLFSLYYYGLCILVLFVNGDSLENSKREIISIAKSYTLISLVSSCFCIYMFLGQISISFPGRSGAEMRMGVWENRLFGIFSSPNVGGTFFSIGICLSLYLLYVSKKKNIWKTLCCFNVIISLWYIILSLSRGTYLSMLTASFISVILFRKPYPKYKRKMYIYLKKVLIWCCFVIAACVFTGLVRNISQSLVNISSKDDIVLERIEYSNNDSVETAAVVQAVEEPASIDISNKRFAIWKASIKMAMQSPAIGVGNSYSNYHNMSLEEQEYFTPNERIMLDYSNGNIHNGYLQIFVYCGCIALTFYVIFLICSLSKVIRFFKSVKNIYVNNQIVFLFGIVIYLLTNNLVESNFALMGANSFQAAFLLFSGYIVWFCNNERQKGKV